MLLVLLEGKIHSEGSVLHNYQICDCASDHLLNTIHRMRHKCCSVSQILHQENPKKTYLPLLIYWLNMLDQVH
jgi:hypothetical protein